MARKLPSKDVVIIGLGWTGSVLGYELAKAGLDVVAIERGPWRDTATDFPPAYAQDELRYAVRLDPSPERPPGVNRDAGQLDRRADEDEIAQVVNHDNRPFDCAQGGKTVTPSPPGGRGPC